MDEGVCITEACADLLSGVQKLKIRSAQAVNRVKQAAPQINKLFNLEDCFNFSDRCTQTTDCNSTERCERDDDDYGFCIPKECPDDDLLKLKSTFPQPSVTQKFSYAISCEGTSRCKRDRDCDRREICDQGSEDEQGVCVNEKCLFDSIMVESQKHSSKAVHVHSAKHHKSHAKAEVKQCNWGNEECDFGEFCNC